jgi:hypothetical protein
MIHQNGLVGVGWTAYGFFSGVIADLLWFDAQAKATWPVERKQLWLGGATELEASELPKPSRRKRKTILSVAYASSCAQARWTCVRRSRKSPRIGRSPIAVASDEGGDMSKAQPYTRPEPPPVYRSFADWLKRTTEKEGKKWFQSKARTSNWEHYDGVRWQDVWRVCKAARGQCVYCGSLAVERKPKGPCEHIGRRIGTLEHLDGGGLAWSCYLCNSNSVWRRWRATDCGGLPQKLRWPTIPYPRLELMPLGPDPEDGELVLRSDGSLSFPDYLADGTPADPDTGELLDDYSWEEDDD